MLEPQSTALFILLMVVFGALLLWVAVSKQPALRVLAAALAFVPAMLFGVAAVNKYYDYYQTWNSVAADLGAQSLTPAPLVPANVSASRLTQILSRVTGGVEAALQGETVRFTITGRLSHLTRTAFVYLPPQYFQPGYRHYRFPAIELLPGYPGEPQDWINVVGITATYATLLQDRTVSPAVLVMPDSNGGRRISLQCLNVVHGPQDATFLALDVPSYLSHTLRLQPPGDAWGIAGYSEGGFCAANLALVYPHRYGYSGVLSGYFVPSKDQLGNPPRQVAPFGHDTRLRLLNTPRHEIRALPVTVPVPQFWLGAGAADRQDVIAARIFQRLLLARQPGVQLHLAPGGGHTMATWRSLVPPLLEWMTPLLAYSAAHPPAPRPAVVANPSRPPVAPVGAGKRPTPTPTPTSRASG